MATKIRRAKLLPGLAASWFTDFVQVFFLIRWRAHVLTHDFFRTPPQCRGSAHPWLRIRRRVGERHADVDRVVISARITFLQLRVFAVRIAAIRKPRSAVEAVALDN